MLIPNSLRAYRVKCCINNISFILGINYAYVFWKLYLQYTVCMSCNQVKIYWLSFWASFGFICLFDCYGVESVPRFGLLPSQGPPIGEGGFKGVVRIYNFLFSRLTYHLAPRAPVPYNVCLKPHSQWQFKVVALSENSPLVAPIKYFAYSP